MRDIVVYGVAYGGYVQFGQDLLPPGQAGLATG